LQEGCKLGKRVKGLEATSESREQQKKQNKTATRKQEQLTGKRKRNVRNAGRKVNVGSNWKGKVLIGNENKTIQRRACRTWRRTIDTKSDVKENNGEQPIGK